MGETEVGVKGGEKGEGQAMEGRRVAGRRISEAGAESLNKITDSYFYRD